MGCEIVGMNCLGSSRTRIFLNRVALAGVSAAVLYAHAGALAQQAAADRQQAPKDQGTNLPPITVQPPEQLAKPRASRKKAPPSPQAPQSQQTRRASEENPTPLTGTIGAPPAAYAGGQVASGERLGFLGNKSVFDTPFSVTTYTDKLIQDQQAKTTLDVLENDPSVRPVQPPFGFQDTIYVRGFLVYPRDFAFDGLYGITNVRRFLLDGVEQVEVLHGPAAFLFGFPPSGSIGGVVNLIPKQAADDPLTRLTTSYISSGYLAESFDLGRRFGENNAFGLRVSGSYGDGGTSIGEQAQQLGSIAVSLDWRGKDVRISSNFGYQHQYLTEPSEAFSVVPGVNIPVAPDLSNRAQQSWERALLEHAYATTRVEYDIAPNLTAFAAAGLSRGYERFLVNFVQTFTSANGNMFVTPVYLTTVIDQKTAEAGLRAKFETGPIQHRVSLVATGFWEIQNSDFAFLNGYSSNVYDPAPVPQPALPGTLGKLIVPEQSKGIAAVDTLSILNDRVQLTLGERLLTLSTSESGALPMPLSEGTAATPLAAILIKPWKPLSLYASYAEGFGFGPTAPIGSANYGAVFPPIVTKQLETGAKLDFGNFGATLTFFQITQPSTFTDPTTNIFSVSGEQQNKGIEFNVFGTLTESVRLLGGISLLDGVLTKTAGGIDNGKMAPGVPHVQLNLGAEYDLPFSAKGFTLTGRVIYTSAQFYDEGNTQSIPGWTRLDLGVRYRWIGEDGNPATVRFNVENVTGENYWASTGAGQLTLGMPRTYKLSLSKDF